jgi:Putative transposase/Transposase zinc-binding domain
LRPSLEVADIFRSAGPAYRAAHAGHLSLHQLKVMSAIEHCRTAALGGHVEACTDCGHWRVAFNSCRNRHCPKCQGAAARTWLEAREADLLPVGYFHVVFTLPAQVADIAFQNKAVVYDLLFRAASETMMIIAADPKHLGARIGITAVLHTWGSALTHHPHVHMIVPGGGIAPSGDRWVASRPAFLLPVRVLGKLFRRLFLTRLMALYDAGRLGFFGGMAHLSERPAFMRRLSPVRKKRWAEMAKVPAIRRIVGKPSEGVYAKPPFAGPEAVLAYLSRYTHRVAISNRRLIAFDETGVTFRYKDYRRPGADRQQVMTVATDAFIHRFLLHVLPRGFHRIRHYGLLASSARKTSLERARALLAVAPALPDDETDEPVDHRPPCPCCGGRMIVIETLERWRQPRAPPQPPATTRMIAS